MERPSSNLLACWRDNPSVAVLTGAGISAASGLPTFRGAGGWWKKYRAEDLATPEAFQKDPRRVWEWYNHRRDLVRRHAPNPGHFALARFEPLCKTFALITQNVDGYHQRAGSANVSELHGNIMKSRCSACSRVCEAGAEDWKDGLPYCSCGALYRPGVVWFGETLPAATLQDAFIAAENCQIFFAIGTSSVVYPAAALSQMALEHGAYVVEINDEATPLTPHASEFLKGRAGEILPALVKFFQSGDKMKPLSTRPRSAFWQIAILAATILSLQGCGAYFNTFYNTKKLYKEALEEQKRRGADNKPTSMEIQKYDKAIEKGSKLLQLHPKSRYVDDTLLLLGECFFYKQEYLKAQRKFQELITIFPKSGLVPRAQIWLAKTSIELNDYAGAELALNELQEREKKGDLANQAQYFLGEIYFRQERLPEAAKALEIAARKLGDEKMRGAAYMRLGECYVALQQYDLAAAALRRAGAFAKNEGDFKFRARLEYADALKNDRRLDEALNVLNGMLKEFSTHRDLPLVKLEIADCTRLRGKIETAIKQYSDIIENHQRTDASAAAFFALGEIHERYNGDYGKAKECYDNVRRESARSDKVTEAASRSKALGELIKLKETIATLERQRVALARGQTDSSPLAVAAQGRASSTSQRSISHVPRRARNAGALVDAAKKSGDPNRLAAELAKSKILLAELFMFNFNRPDSAMREYLDVFEFFPQTEYAPQAMYSLAYILGDAPATLVMRDSILQVLALQYSNTPQGRGAKWQLNGADTLALAVPSTPNLLRSAEEALIAQNNAKRAVQLYQEFLQRQPEQLNPKLAAQSLYAIGWIYEHKLSDNKQALAAYKKLIEAYPDSPVARRVRAKVTAVEQKKSEPPKAEPSQPDSTAPVAVAPQEQPAPALSDSLKTAPPLIEDEDIISTRKKDVERPPKPDSSEVDSSEVNEELEKRKNEENKDKEPPEPQPI